MSLDSRKGHHGCTIQRHQFTVRPVLAIIIRKAQGHALQFIGVYLKISIFINGLLCVDFSRDQSQNNFNAYIFTYVF